MIDPLDETVTDPARQHRTGFGDGPFFAELRGKRAANPPESCTDPPPDLRNFTAAARRAAGGYTPIGEGVNRPKKAFKILRLLTTLPTRSRPLAPKSMPAVS